MSTEGSLRDRLSPKPSACTNSLGPHDNSVGEDYYRPHLVGEETEAQGETPPQSPNGKWQTECELGQWLPGS